MGDPKIFGSRFPKKSCLTISNYLSREALPRVGVGIGWALVLWRTFIVCPAVDAVCRCSSGYFFVDGQIKRHGWVFTVSLKSLMLRPAGPRSFMVAFNRSEESRKF